MRQSNYNKPARPRESRPNSKAKGRGPTLHHILHGREEWESTPQSYWLREESGLLVLMGNEEHITLHQKTDIVPLLDIHMSLRVIDAMKKSNATKPLDRMSDFVRGVENAMKHPRTSEDNRLVGGKVIEAVEAQEKYIHLGITSAQDYDLTRVRRRN